MNTLHNLSIKSKLSAAFALMLVLLTGVAIFAAVQMDQQRLQTHEINTNWLPSVELVNKLNTATSDFRIQEMRHVAITNSAGMEQIAKRMEQQLADIQQLRSAYEKLISSQEERTIYGDFSNQWNRYLQVHEQVLKLSSSNANEQAQALLEGDASQTFAQASKTLEQLVQLNHDGAHQAGEQSEHLYTSSRNALFATLAGAVAVALVAAGWLIRSIVGPIGQAMVAAERIATGDLSEDIDVRSTDEVGRLLTSMQHMQENLSRTVQAVRQNADSVATASSEISQGNADLSSRTEKQASALEETAASMEQIQGTVRQNADNAAQANQLAQSANVAASRGGTVVNEVVHTMKQIDEASRQIVEIIGVIDGIAFQTNILALNAAVEAARAGDQGRGFAVVAGEVRNLAQRSAEAAKQIKSLITANAERVEAGATLVGQAGAAMGDIVQSIQRVTDIMGEITAASKEQSAGVAQVAEAVTHMDQATQQNAALVEESAAAADSLKQQARQLVDVVSVFRVSSGADSLPVRPATSQPALDQAPASSSTGSAWNSVERRGPNRATNVRRIHPKKPPTPVAAPAFAPVAPPATTRTGTDDWESF